MRKFFQYLKVVFLVGPVIVYYLLFKINKIYRHMDEYSFEQRFYIIRDLFRHLTKRFRVDFHHQNQEQFREYKGKRLIICNHLSVIDPILYLAEADRPVTFVAKKEVEKYPIIGKILKILGGFSIDRSNVMGQLAEIRKIVNFLKSDEPVDVLIFAEGTRNKNPGSKCLDFHAGTMKIASMANVPIVAIASFGSWRILEMKHYLPSYPIFYNYGKTRTPEEIADMKSIDIATMLQKEIDDKIVDIKKQDKDEVYKRKISLRRKALETIVDIGVNS